MQCSDNNEIYIFINRHCMNPFNACKHIGKYALSYLMLHWGMCMYILKIISYQYGVVFKPNSNNNAQSLRVYYYHILESSKKKFDGIRKFSIFVVLNLTKAKHGKRPLSRRCFELLWNPENT